MALHLVRHGPPQIRPGRPASTWPLDATTAHEELRKLRRVLVERAPSAIWHSSDEPKAVATARHLTDQPVGTTVALREAYRSDWFATREEFRAAVSDAFSQPDRPARPGWEPLADTRRRIAVAVRQLVGQGAGDVVLVGHGTAWTLLIAELTERPPDRSAWARLRTPDLCTVDLEARAVRHGWGDW